MNVARRSTGTAPSAAVPCVAVSAAVDVTCRYCFGVTVYVVVPDSLGSIRFSTPEYLALTL